MDFAFWLLAIVSVAAALAVVLLRDVFRAALALVLCFIMVAGLYVTLSADFLAAVQILVYVGAIAILLILGIMLTRDVQRGSLSNKLRFPASLVALIFLGTVTFAVLNTQWVIPAGTPIEPTTATLAGQLFGENGYILTVEIAAVLLLAAIIGAIVLVREK
ncbi:MAG: NADH-quinone oxidoreductase subunit J [Dehalococcoidales bacterium]|nr:MAG: NADH-quinone oxidoreductase subunit J [Dehalococcoidales bacterium]